MSDFLKGSERMKKWIIYLFPLLLAGCFFSVPGDVKQSEITRDDKMTLKIINGEEGDRFFIEIIPTGSEMNEHLRVITDENHEAKVSLNVGTSYTLFVMKTDVDSLDELKNVTFDDDAAIEDVQLFQITPSKGMETINMDLQQFDE